MESERRNNGTRKSLAGGLDMVVERQESRLPSTWCGGERIDRSSRCSATKRKARLRIVHLLIFLPEGRQLIRRDNHRSERREIRESIRIVAAARGLQIEHPQRRPYTVSRWPKKRDWNMAISGEDVEPHRILGSAKSCHVTGPQAGCEARI